MKATAVMALLALTLTVHAQQKDTPEPPEQQHAAMMKRGDHGMGFSQEKTTHHFRLFVDGGKIEVNANDPKDLSSREEIRMHLSHVAQMFSGGDFNVPMFVHDTTPPGVPTMTKLSNQIQYQFQETGSGGRIRIETANAQALEAVHAFLRFQIAEHRTGDSTESTASSNQTAK